MGSSLRYFLRPPITSCLFCPYSFLRTLSVWYCLFIPLLIPPRFYHFNNITYYKLESTLSLTSALDGGFHGLAHGEIYKYGCPHGKIVSSQLLLWPPQIQIQSSTLRPQTLPFYSTMCTSVSVKATGKVFYAICQSVGSSGTLRCVVGWTVPYVSRGI